MLNRRIFVKSVLGGALLSSLYGRAWAHRQKQALTTIEWNPRTKILEVTHDLHAHDAEQALAKLGLITTPDLTGLRARASLALYVREHFQLSTLNEKVIDLTILGAETDATYAHVYMEAELTEPPSGLLISNTMLQDVFVDQVNQVNVSLSDTVHSVVFIAGDIRKKILA
jgi:Domain of unknown function (DUF6702)